MKRSLNCARKIIAALSFIFILGQQVALSHTDTTSDGTDNDTAVTEEEASTSTLTWPKQKAVTGKKNLICVAVMWTDQKSITKADCLTLAKLVANFYNKNSQGQINLIPSAGTVNTGVASTGRNISEGENLATRTFKADYYLIPNLRNSGDNAGNKIAHLSQMTGTAGIHEMGHLLGLNHSSVINATPLYDRGTIMNPDSRSSNFILASQYYYLGWMPKSDAVLYDGSQNAAFEIKHPLDASTKEPATVIVSPSLLTPGHTLKNVFISYPPNCQMAKTCAVLHLVQDGGAEMVKEIAVGTTFDDSAHSGLIIDVHPGTSSQTIRVTINTQG
jgi:hypothetical protein